MSVNVNYLTDTELRYRIKGCLRLLGMTREEAREAAELWLLDANQRDLYADIIEAELLLVIDR